MLRARYWYYQVHGDGEDCTKEQKAYLQQQQQQPWALKIAKELH